MKDIAHCTIPKHSNWTQKNVKMAAQREITDPLMYINVSEWIS